MTPFSSLVRGEAKENRTELAQAMIDARLEAGYTNRNSGVDVYFSIDDHANGERERLADGETLEKWAEVTGKRLEIRFI